MTDRDAQRARAQEAYKALCADLGRHLYPIKRDVDNLSVALSEAAKHGPTCTHNDAMFVAALQLAQAVSSVNQVVAELSRIHAILEH